MTRKCYGCKKGLKKWGYSNTQWGKGEGCSRCKGCVAKGAGGGGLTTTMEAFFEKVKKKSGYTASASLDCTAPCLPQPSNLTAEETQQILEATYHTTQVSQTAAGGPAAVATAPLFEGNVREEAVKLISHALMVRRVMCMRACVRTCVLPPVYCPLSFLSASTIFLFLSHQKPRHLRFLARFDLNLKSFLADDTLQRYLCESMGNYQRLLVHRIADTSSIQHLVEFMESGDKSIALYKTADGYRPEHVAWFSELVVLRQQSILKHPGRADEWSAQVPVEAMGLVIGRGGANIKGLKGIPGIQSVKLSGAPHMLVARGTLGAVEIVRNNINIHLTAAARTFSNQSRQHHTHDLVSGRLLTPTDVHSELSNAKQKQHKSEKRARDAGRKKKEAARAARWVEERRGGP